jgi:AraC-like DNA-binding protein
MAERGPRPTGAGAQQRLVLPAPIIHSVWHRPLVSGLLATGAGYFPKTAGLLWRQPAGTDQLGLLYCVKGAGWCEVNGKRHNVRPGDLVVLPPRAPCACGATDPHPWTLHLAEAIGTQVPEYIRELGASPEHPIVWVGEDLQLVFLFNEVRQTLGRGFAFLQLLRASHALAYLLALLIQHRRERSRDAGEGLEKVARCIIYMSEHLDQPLKVSHLSALANLSPAHFTALFKQQTGSAPRDYLHLLRMHRACQWLTGGNLSLKEIAGSLGYQDQFHFSRKFKAFSGLAPSEYRATHRPGASGAE